MFRAVKLERFMRLQRSMRKLRPRCMLRADFMAAGVVADANLR
jgi:hypothetical protein